jgi:hypothetical protein
MTITKISDTSHTEISTGYYTTIETGREVLTGQCFTFSPVNALS